MKKNILFAVVALFGVIMLNSCSKDTENMTWVTSFPTLEIIGESKMVVRVGDPYVDQGCKAMLNGEDLSDQIEVENNVNPDVMGAYSVTYTIKSADGFPKSVKRTVYVANPGCFNNLYLATVSMVGGRTYSNIPTMISKNDDGTYLIDDIMSGYYWYGRYPGYEPTYDFHCETILELAADNTFKAVSFGDWYFIKSGPTSASGTFDPVTGVVTYTTDFDTTHKLIPMGSN